MQLKFIEPEITPFDKKQQQPASYIRKEFVAEKIVRKATGYMTALGVYVPYLNGSRISDEQLLPGFTNYKRRLQYQKFDLTERVHRGCNVIGCVLGDGWYRGNVGAFNKRNVYGTALKFACRLELEYEDGTKEIIETDSSWMACQDGPLRENDLKIVENYDARKELGEWMSPERCFDSGENRWHSCRDSSYTGKLVPSLGEKVLEQEQFSPKLLCTPDGSMILDFGQNHAGHVEFTVTGPEGAVVSLIMGEALDEKGNFTLKNLQGEGKSAEVMALGQRLNYTLKEGTQTYKSTFLNCGYQYVKLENWPEEIKPENFKGIAVYSALRETGTFTCSNPLVNQLVENVRWSQKSNFVDIPTDCPQRERAGWAGDINVFIETANYLTDTRRFIRKWMEDFIGSQHEDGALPYIIPEVPAMGAGISSAGWSDAISTLPLMQYRFYGGQEVLEASYDAVKKFVEYNRRRAKRRHLTHIYRIEPHYSYILDTGFHYGEWLEPGGSNIKDGLKAMFKPDAEAATAWFYYTTRNLVKMAEVLGKGEDVKTYSLLAKKIRNAYRKEFLPGGQVHSHRQCRYVRPIYMGLAERSEIPGIAERLNQLCIAGHYRIGTGFLTTYQVLQVLVDCGYTDTAYRMLENEECPGWLYEVKQGANTVWEGWDAIEPKTGKLKPLSQNHYAPGAVVSWLFSHCAGIRPVESGFRKIEIRPVPGGSFTFARAEYDSTVGKIISDWKLEDGKFILRVEVPEGIETRVILPDGKIYENAQSGCYECRL